MPSDEPSKSGSMSASLTRSARAPRRRTGSPDVSDLLGIKFDFRSGLLPRDVAIVGEQQWSNARLVGETALEKLRADREVRCLSIRAPNCPLNRAPTWPPSATPSFCRTSAPAQSMLAPSAGASQAG